MRIVALLVVLAASSATAQRPMSPEARAERDRWSDESFRVCRENVSGWAEVDTCRIAAESGLLLHVMETEGVGVEPQFELDSRDPAELREISRACRLATEDGGLVDGLSALFCIQEEVQIRNRDARRAKRGAGDE